MKTISEEDGWRLLEQITFNDRTLLCWYNPNNSVISLFLFNAFDKPNSLSERSPESTYGYVTHMVTGMYSELEAAEVVGLYLKDLEKDNIWWENDN